MGFEKYRGGIELGAGLSPASEGYPLMQTCDIQADADGTRLDEYLANLKTNATDGITPKIKLENGYLYVSYDNGSSWEELGYVQGTDASNGSYTRIKEVALLASGWVKGDFDNLYSQAIEIADVTESTKVDMALSAEQLVAFYEKDITFVTESIEGVVTFYCIGQKPDTDYTIQITLTEANGSSAGGGQVSGGTGGVQSDYDVNDSNDPAYIWNRPFHDASGEVTLEKTASSEMVLDPRNSFSFWWMYYRVSDEPIDKDRLIGAVVYGTLSHNGNDGSWVQELEKTITEDSINEVIGGFQVPNCVLVVTNCEDYNYNNAAGIRVNSNGVYLIHSYTEGDSYGNTTEYNKLVYATSELKTLDNKFLDLEGHTDFIKLSNKVKVVESIAKGANQAVSFDDYNQMMLEVSGFEKDKFEIGQNIYIKDIDVPDLWVAGKNANFIPVSTLEEADLLHSLSQTNSVSVGWYTLSALETQKVNLQYANSTTAGVVKTGYSTNDKNYAVKVDGSGNAYVNVPWNTTGLPDDALGFLCTNGSVGLAYDVGDTTAVCIDIEDCTESDVEIGSMVMGLPVRAIYDNAFRNCSSIISVTIPDSVTGIYENAFEDCTSLRRVNIPNGVSLISEAVFYNCSSLETITIPASVGTIDIAAFSHCKSLNNIIIGRGVQEICGSAFNDCTALENVFYLGTEAEWNAITIDQGNECLTNATIYYYSGTAPGSEGNYWHYVNGIPTVW